LELSSGRFSWGHRGASRFVGWREHVPFKGESTALAGECAGRTWRERHTEGLRACWPRASDRSRVKQRIHPTTVRFTGTPTRGEESTTREMQANQPSSVRALSSPGSTAPAGVRRHVMLSRTALLSSPVSPKRGAGRSKAGNSRADGRSQ